MLASFARTVEAMPDIARADQHRRRCHHCVNRTDRVWSFRRLRRPGAGVAGGPGEARLLLPKKSGLSLAALMDQSRLKLFV
jgi:hypothetical protein